MVSHRAPSSHRDPIGVALAAFFLALGLILIVVGFVNELHPVGEVLVYALAAFALVVGVTGAITEWPKPKGPTEYEQAAVVIELYAQERSEPYISIHELQALANRVRQLQYRKF